MEDDDSRQKRAQRDRLRNLRLKRSPGAIETRNARKREQRRVDNDKIAVGDEEAIAKKTRKNAQERQRRAIVIAVGDEGAIAKKTRKNAQERQRRAIVAEQAATGVVEAQAAVVRHAARNRAAYHGEARDRAVDRMKQRRVAQHESTMVERARDWGRLEEGYKASPNVPIYNSSRLAPLAAHGDRASLEQAVKDVAADIKKIAVVTEDDKARCIAEFKERQDAFHFNVCASCGVRDPVDAKYVVRTVADVKKDHWLEFTDEDLDDLESRRQRKFWYITDYDDAGAPVFVELNAAQFRNLVTDSTSQFKPRFLHLVPEAIFLNDDGVQTFYLCSTCATAFDKDKPSHYSIANGRDYGRLRVKLDNGDMLAIQKMSQMEVLLIAKARTHMVVYKVQESLSSPLSSRPRSIGHTITFVQDAKPASPLASGLGKHAIEAALEHAQIYVVGPKGRRTTLETRALQLTDIETIRADALFNWQNILYHVPDERHPRADVPPTVEEFRTIYMPYCAEHAGADARAVLMQHAVHIDDTTIDEAVGPDDIANVRTVAQGGESAAAAETADSNAEATSHVGVVPPPGQSMADLLAKIRTTVATVPATGGDDDEDDDDADAADRTNRAIYITRSDDVYNDYAGAADLYYDCFPQLFVLRDGLVRGKSIPKTKLRHIVLHFDGRFSDNPTVIFVMANTVTRHATNQGVAARIKNHKKKFDDFSALVNAPTFPDELRAAEQDPTGKPARVLAENLLKFINLSTRAAPWSGRERRNELPKLITNTRNGGASNVFYSFAPDDVKALPVIRYSIPHTSYDALPHAAAPDFAILVAQLRAVIPEDRNRREPAMDERTLQANAANNCVATALFFRRVTDDVGKALFQIDPDHKVDVDFTKHRKGILGITTTKHEVYECNSRAAQHTHGQTQGGLAPALVADVAGFHDEFPELAMLVFEALESQIDTELPIENHAVAKLLRATNLTNRRDAAMPIPTDADEFQKHARLTVTNKNVHSHQATCTKGLLGLTGCRMCVPYVHDVDKTRLAMLVPKQSQADVDDDAHMTHLNEPGAFRFRCRRCYGVASNNTIDEEDASRGVDYDMVAPKRKSATLLTSEGFGEDDDRALVLELRRRHLDHPDCGNQSALLDAIVNARAQQASFDGDNGDAKRQHFIRAIMADNEPLARIIRDHGAQLAHLDDKLRALAECDLTNETDVKALRRVTDHLVADSMLCRNSVVADFSPTLSGCVNANANPLHMGAGLGAKRTTMYSCKYMVKDFTQVVVLASILNSCYKTVTQFPSTADDAGTDARKAKQYAQRIINNSVGEMEATVAASIVLGNSSSVATLEHVYISGWSLAHFVKSRFAPAANDKPMIFLGESNDDDDAASTSSDESENATVPDDDTDDDDDRDAARPLFDDDDDCHDSKCGFATLFNIPETADTPKRLVAVSDAQNCAYRDLRLHDVSALEFKRHFRIRKMTPNDRKWYLAYRQDPSTPSPPDGPGRPVDRFVLEHPHPLMPAPPQTPLHLIVRRRKSAIVALAGPPPPKYEDSERKRAAFAKFWSALVKPWSAVVARPDLGPTVDFDSFVRFHIQLEHDACFYGPREPDNYHETAEGRAAHARRIIAVGRIVSIHNYRAAFVGNSQAAAMHSRHRTIARDLWRDTPAPIAAAPSDARQRQNSALVVANMRSSMDQERNTTTVDSRLKEAGKRTDAANTMVAVLDGARPTQPGPRPPVEARLYAAAHDAAARACPNLRTLTSHATDVHAALRAPLPEQPQVRPEPGAAAPDLHTGVAPNSVQGGFATVNEIPLPASLAFVDEAAYQRQSSAWLATPEPSRGKPPLNPEQRAIGAVFYRVMTYRAHARLRGETAEQIRDTLKAARTPAVFLLIGAGGTGKTECILTIIQLALDERLGRVPATGYTGVAAALFLSATLLTMLGISINPQNNFAHLTNLDQAGKIRKRAKFKEETGYEITDVAGIS